MRAFPLLLLLAALLCAAAAQAQVFNEEDVRAFFQHAHLEMRFQDGQRLDVEFLPGVALSDGASDMEEVQVEVAVQDETTLIVFATPHGGADVARILTFENDTLTILPEDDYADGDAATFVTRERMTPEAFEAYRSSIAGAWRLHRIGSFDAARLNISFSFGAEGDFRFDARHAATLPDEAFAGAPPVLELLINQGVFEAAWHPTVGAYPSSDEELRRRIVWRSGHDLGSFRIIRIADGQLLLEVDEGGVLDLRRAL
jgi:hypothetical protein